MLHVSKFLAGVALASALMLGAASAQTVLKSSDTHPDAVSYTHLTLPTIYSV